ncbi:MAG: GNAT family N-acetyltransferase [Cyanobacteria bacterium J06632_22]
MTSSDYAIRPMTRAELDQVVGWAAAEGWNPGMKDADCFYRADPTGFRVGLLNGQPIAAISAVKYGTSFGFIGFYIVRPEFRGQGYGWPIWQAGMAALAGRNVGLDGVVAQQANYLKSGFSLAYRNIRYEGKVTSSMAEVSGLVPLASLPVEAVIDYDRRFFPAEREQFLRGWLAQPTHRGLGKVSGNDLIGYGVLRPCQTGYKIGPLFAETAEIAEDIFRGLRSHLPPNTLFYLDTPEINPAAVTLAEKYNMHRSFETARMYTQQAPDLPLDQIFGVTTFELG